MTGVLLVGGASSRFGEAKALAELEGETLAQRAWRLLREACDERVAVGKHGDGLELGFPLLEDASDARAPLAGLVAGLRAAHHDLCAVIPVDAPLLTAGSLWVLASACRDAAVPQTGPLPGVYRRTATLPVLEERLAHGELSLRDALAELDTAVVELPTRVLMNVNTPDDLRAVRDAAHALA